MSMLDVFRNPSDQQKLCREIKRAVEADLKGKMNFNAEKRATDIFPVKIPKTYLELRQYESGRDQFVKDVVVEVGKRLATSDNAPKSVQEITVEVGHDAAAVSYILVVAFFRNDK
jgi:hypothetical protein